MRIQFVGKIITFISMVIAQEPALAHLPRIAGLGLRRECQFPIDSLLTFILLITWLYIQAVYNETLAKFKNTLRKRFWSYIMWGVI